MQTLKLSHLKWIMMLGFAALLVPTAHADTVYTLTDNGCVNKAQPLGCGTSPFGQVDLAQDGNSVDVTVTLFNGDGFIKSGSGDALEFNLTGDPAITITSLATGFTSNGPDSAKAYGSFDYSLVCSNCISNTTGLTPNLGPLTFTVSLTGGGTLTAADFTDNTGGWFFSADIQGNNGGQGAVGSDGPGMVTPEPGTMLLLTLGLFAMAGLMRKRLAPAA